VYGGLALAVVCTIAGALTFLKHPAGWFAWIAAGMLVPVITYLIVRRRYFRASEYIELDATGITSVNGTTVRTLPWSRIARLSVTRWGALEVADPSGFMVITIRRRLENFVGAAAIILTQLDATYPQRFAGARSRPSDVPATFASSVLPEILQALGSVVSTVACAWFNPFTFLLGLVAMPVTMWRLSHTPYAITVGPAVRFHTLAWTRELPIQSIEDVALAVDERGRPSIAIVANGELILVVIYRLTQRPLELFDRLRRLRDSRTSTPTASAITTTVAFARGTVFLSACAIVTALVVATPIFNGGVLRLASLGGSSKIAELALALGSPIDAKGTDRTTPLYIAAKAGRLPIVKLLLARGADPSTHNRDVGFTPLHVAGEYGHTAIVRVLLDAGVNPDVRNDWQQSPLWQVSWQNRSTDVEVATMLIDAGATVDAHDKDGFTPLHTAVSHGNLPLIRYLASRRANLNAHTNKGITPMRIAMAQGRTDALRALIECGVNIDAIDPAEHSRTALVDAVLRDRRPTVEALLTAGARTDLAGDDGYDALRAAVKVANLPLTELLLRYKADPNAPSDRLWLPLMTAIADGHPEVARALMKGGARWDVAVGGYNALQYAAFLGKTDVIGALLDEGADPNAPSQTHPPPIILAAERGHLAVVTLLVDRGANINESYQQWTALRAAQQRGHGPVIQYILAHGGM
jgi:ankyrin repeat protein